MNFLHQLHDPQSLSQLLQNAGMAGALALLFVIIFAETGLLVGFFLPGDSLIFIAGAVAALYPERLNIGLMIVVLCVAAVVGDATGFLIGRKVGQKLYERPDSRLFKRSHLDKTHAFYEKHGPKTIVLARFVPIVRTFAPTVAGVGGMSYRAFALYNIIGGVGWITSMSLLGFFLGRQEWIQKNIEKAVLLIVFLSILPMILHWMQERRHKKAKGAAVAAVAPGLEIDS